MNTKKPPRLFLGFFLAFMAHASSGHTMGEMKFTCPLTGTEFAATVDFSGTQFCKRLDLKPIGPTPAPWKIPECPDDGMVLFKDEFTQEELEVLRPWIRSAHYQEELRRESTHFRTAESLRVLGAPHDEVAWSYLQASWQVEQDPARYLRYAALALQSFESYLASGQAAARDKDSINPGQARTLSAELARRLGRFDLAASLLHVASHEARADDDVRAWIGLVQRYVDAKDSSARVMVFDDDSTCAEWSRRTTDPM